MTFSYADVDPTAVALGWLKAHERVLAEFTEAGISGEREAPWPHLRVLPGAGGSLGNLRTQPANFEVVLEVYGHPDGSTGSARARRLAIIAVEALLELADADHVPGTPWVVSTATPGIGPDKQDLSNGQHRWVGSVYLGMRPAV